MTNQDPDERLIDPDQFDDEHEDLIYAMDLHYMGKEIADRQRAIRQARREARKSDEAHHGE